MDWTLIASTAGVSAVTGGMVTYAGQRANILRQSRVNYEFDARVRLLNAIGPLRYQLFQACKDVYWRVSLHSKKQDWDLTPNGEYGRTFIYRILRPLAIGLLVEEQSSYVDFTVDTDTGRLFQFDVTAYRMLSGYEPVAPIVAPSWEVDVQHIPRDRLRGAASTLIRVHSDSNRVVGTYQWFAHEYPDLFEDVDLALLAELFRLAQGNLSEYPEFWVRIVGYAYACQLLLKQFSKITRMRVIGMDARQMLLQSASLDVRRCAHLYPKLYKDVYKAGL